IFGDGSQTRSFCYVDDMTEGLIRMMAAPDHLTGPLNLGNPVEYTIQELAEAIVRLSGSSSRIIQQPLPADDPKRRRPDITLAREALDWEPKVGLEQGLGLTIDYFRELLEQEA
ncbi:MAG: GDP-mannose 4,6-dehydratase, partial [Desulfobacteraceae bacterium]